LATLGAWLIIVLIGAAVAAALAILRIRLAPIGAGAVAGGFVLTQAAALALGWSRQARLFALFALAGQGRASVKLDPPVPEPVTG
jgi:hypothetical protein